MFIFLSPDPSTAYSEVMLPLGNLCAVLNFQYAMMSSKLVCHSTGSVFQCKSDICRRNRGIPNADFIDETFVLQALASATLSDVQASLFPLAFFRCELPGLFVYVHV